MTKEVNSMIRSMFTKKRMLTALSVVSVIAIAAVAYGYWTTSGSGDGTASAGSTTGITVNQTSTLTAMYPGDSAQTLSGDFTNTNSSPVYVGTVTASIQSVDKASDAPAGTCDATDFTLSNAAMTVNAQVPSGTNEGAWSGATIKFNDKSDTNQDACKGATVNLHYAIG
jgi:hypothetical protein